MESIPLYRVTLRRVRHLTFKEAVTRPVSAARVIRRVISNSDREALIVVYLNAQNGVLGVEVASVGSLNTTRTTPREIFKGAILAGALGIIMGHNHPSGSLEPSDEDLAFTRAVARAGELVGIELYDHLIIGDDGHTSLRERGVF